MVDMKLLDLINRLILLFSSLCSINLFCAYKKPDCYWYWSEGAGDFSNLHTTFVRNRPFNKGAGFGGGVAAGAAIIGGPIGLGIGAAAAAAAEAIWNADEVNRLYRYYWNCRLMRARILPETVIPLKDKPESLFTVFSEDSVNENTIEFRKIKNSLAAPLTANPAILSPEKIRDYEVEFEGWGKRGKSARDSISEDVDQDGQRIKSGINPDEVYSSLEQGLMILNFIRSYEYGSISKPFLDMVFKKEINRGKLFDYWVPRLGFPKNSSSSIRKRVLDKKFAVKYGDKVRLVSTGSGLTLYGYDKDVAKNKMVFASHDDTIDEITKMNALLGIKAQGSGKKKASSEKVTAPSDAGWYVIKGPFEEGKPWNCEIGEPVQDGDVIRLENVLTKKALVVNLSSAPANSSLLYSRQPGLVEKALGFVDWRYCGSPSVASAVGELELKYPNKPASDECLVSLSKNSVGSKESNLVVKFVEPSTSSGGLVIGQLVAFEAEAQEDSFLWSQHAYFSEGPSFGLVSCLKVENKDEDLSSNSWFVAAVDSPDARALMKIKMQMIAEKSQKQEQQLAAFIHTAMKKANKNYFNGVIAPEGAYPELDTDSMAVIFVDAFVDFFKLLPLSFWKDPKFKNATDAVNSMVVELRSKFPSSEELASALDDFEMNVLTKNPLFKKRSFRELMTFMDRAFFAEQPDDEVVKSNLKILRESRLLLLQKTGFKNLEDLLNGSKKPEANIENSQIGATIFSSWLKAQQKALVDSGICTSDELTSWLKMLRDIEVKIYVNESSIDVGSAAIQSALDILAELLDKDELLFKDKRDLVDKFIMVFSKSNYDKMLKPEQVDLIMQGLKTLGAKFLLATDADVGNDFKKLMTMITNAVVFGLEYLVGQFNSKLVELDQLVEKKDSSSKIEELLSLLKNVNQFKAGFDFLEKNALSAFINNSEKAFKSNAFLKAYEEELKQKSFDDQLKSSFILNLSFLKEASSFSDYFYLFVNLAKQAAAQQVIGQKTTEMLTSIVSTRLSVSPYNSFISAKKMLQINTAIEVLLSKKVSSIQQIAFDSKAFSFDNYLATVKNLIFLARDASGQWKAAALFAPDLKAKISFLDLVDLVCSFKEFSPDFSREQDLFGMISLLKYLQSCFLLFQEKYEGDALRLNRLMLLARSINDSIISENKLASFAIDFPGLVKGSK